MKKGDERTSLLECVASMYFEDGLMQEEIAEQLYISRTRISRLLKEAIESGVVEIKVHHAVERSYELEERIRTLYNLNDVYLVNCRMPSSQSLLHRVASLAAAYVDSYDKSHMTLGISWGSTMRETVRCLTPDPATSVSIVQLMGACSEDDPDGSLYEIMHQVEQLYATKVYTLNAPLHVDSTQVRDGLLADPMVKKSLQIAAACDMVLTGIGSLDAINHERSWSSYMNDSMRKEILDKNGVGCLCAHFYDKDGELLNCQWNQGCIGISLNTLRWVPNVIAVATGAHKATAIKGALCGGYINVLVSDSDTAYQLLDESSITKRRNET